MAPTLQLSRATEGDIDGLLDPIYAAFEGNDIRTMFFGHDTPACRASAKTRIAEWMREGNQNVWLKVVEQETGQIIGGSWWMQKYANTKLNLIPTYLPQIYPNWTPNPALTPTAAAAAVKLDFLSGPDDDRAMGETLMRDFLARRARHTFGQPHILLALLFTAPSHQRRGAGSLQMRWGAALADRLLVPLYVEATAAGRPTYAAGGCVDVEEVRTVVRPAEGKTTASDGKDCWVCEYTMMRREPRGVEMVVGRGEDELI
ncbi:hypothetical protein SLS58_008456 [Diplodia intermedia]|uniref:N-acetyltransferase domain-containing protein n=1 Tax=Diplodia intermedia TaxID=856260 RepID=A0ABR3THD7_9PEZI